MMSDATDRGTQRASSAVVELQGFDGSVTELNALLKQILEWGTTRAATDEAEREEFFGPLLDSEEVRRRLGVSSTQEVVELVRSGKLLVLPSREGELIYPAFQFSDEGNVYPEIERITAIFDGVVVTPITIASWLRGPKEYLEGLSPMRWLELGRDPEPVIAGAEVAAARLAR
jgi:hypothetical protein